MRILPSTVEGTAVTPPDHEGAVGKQWGRVSSLESRRCSPAPVDPKGRTASLWTSWFAAEQSASLL